MKVVNRSSSNPVLNAEILRSIDLGKKSQIAQGSMATIHRVDGINGVPLAVKVPRSDVLRPDLNRHFFRNEGDVLAVLYEETHPNVVTLLAWGDIEGRPFLAMEYENTISVQACLSSSNPLSPEDGLLIGEKAARGIGSLHAKGWVHVDVKPGNLLWNIKVGDEAIVKVIDFAFARPAGTWQMDVFGHRLEEPKSFWGSEPYLSYNRLLGTPPNYFDDIYALGMSLLHILLGAIPHGQDHYWREPYKLVVDIIRSPIPDPLKDLLLRLMHLPRKFEGICKDPIHSAEEAAVEIGRLRKKL